MSPKEFLLFSVRSIVEHPDDVAVEQREDEFGTLVTLRVHQSDMPTVIGKAGQTIAALRTVLRVFGARQNARVNLKLIEDERKNAS